LEVESVQDHDYKDEMSEEDQGDTLHESSDSHDTQNEIWEEESKDEEEEDVMEEGVKEEKVKP